MSDFTLGGTLIGVALIVAYVAWSVRRGRRPELNDAAELFLGALAGAGGVKLAVIAFTAEQLKPLTDEDRGYMILGAVGVLWIAGATAARVFSRLRAAT